MGNITDFLSIGMNRYSICRGLHGKLDMQTIDPEKWLRAISADLCKDDTKEKPTPRALKKLDKIAKDIRVETGDSILLSMFLNVAVKRDHVTTRVVDGRDMDDFKERCRRFGTIRTNPSHGGRGYVLL